MARTVPTSPALLSEPATCGPTADDVVIQAAPLPLLERGEPPPADTLIRVPGMNQMHCYTLSPVLFQNAC